MQHRLADQLDPQALTPALRQISAWLTGSSREERYSRISRVFSTAGIVFLFFISEKPFFYFEKDYTIKKE